MLWPIVHQRLASQVCNQNSTKSSQKQHSSYCLDPACFPSLPITCGTAKVSNSSFSMSSIVCNTSLYHEVPDLFWLRSEIPCENHTMRNLAFSCDKGSKLCLLYFIVFKLISRWQAISNITALKIIPHLLQKSNWVLFCSFIECRYTKDNN